MRTTTVVALMLLLAACSHRTLVYERALDDGPEFSAYLVSYVSSGLKVHAMVAVPDIEMPAAGYPVVIANHGYVPDPTKYGIAADGIDSRPGDYYRSVPELYTSRGFLVVLPDYRGHNTSEGLEFTGNSESIGFYADDVEALMAGLDEIEDADMNNIFMWSHSMGGPVSMRVLLATKRVKAASFWATSSLEDLESRLDDLDIPLLLQNSDGDRSGDKTNSAVLAAMLDALDIPYTYYRYEGPDHFFEGQVREQAADRDAAFFRSLIRPETLP